MRRVIRAGIIIFLSLSLFNAEAAPTGSDLVKACKHALEYGFNDIKGMMCTWYITPCDCNYEIRLDVPRVCLPPQISVETLALTVVGDIKAEMELGTMNAESAAAKILSKYYPCPE